MLFCTLFLMKRKGRAGGWHHAVLAHSLGCCTWAPCLGILAFPGWLTKHNHGLHGLSARAPNFTAFHGFSESFPTQEWREEFWIQLRRTRFFDSFRSPFGWSWSWISGTSYLPWASSARPRIGNAVAQICGEKNGNNLSIERWWDYKVNSDVWPRCFGWSYGFEWPLRMVTTKPSILGKMEKKMRTKTSRENSRASFVPKQLPLWGFHDAFDRPFHLSSFLVNFFWSFALSHCFVWHVVAFCRRYSFWMYLEILQATKRLRNFVKLSSSGSGLSFHVFVLFVFSCLVERLLKGWDPHQEGDNNCEEQSLQSVKQYW